MDFIKIYDDLSLLEVGVILKNEPMYKHTTFKVGGPTQLYIKVYNIEKLKVLMNYIKENKIDYYVVGRGSNLLFSDKQYDGIVISLNEYFNSFEFEGEYLKCQAGVPMIKLAKEACKRSLSGLEFVSGIPGSIGGGIYMNAGAYNEELSTYVAKVTIIDEEGNIKEIENGELHFSYRHSVFQEQPEWIILDALIKLNHGDKENIRYLMEKRKKRRLESQPLDFPNAGSVFINPEGKASWQLIDECGLRGKKIGGAKVSCKHSNFIVNEGYASAKDVLDLIELIRETVYETFGILMHTEIRLVNW